MQEKDKHALVYFNIVVEVTDNAVCVCVTQGREGDEAICPYRWRNSVPRKTRGVDGNPRPKNKIIY